MSSNDALLINSDGIMNDCKVCLRLDSDSSIEEATNKVLGVHHKLVLFDLKKFAHSFSLKLSFCTSRAGRWITCNRDHRQGSVKKESFRSFKSITCCCDWSIQFRYITKNNNKMSDPVNITSVNAVHFNTCDPSYIDQIVLSWTRAGEYKRCVD